MDVKDSHSTSELLKMMEKALLKEDLCIYVQGSTTTPNFACSK